MNFYTRAAGTQYWQLLECPLFMKTATSVKCNDRDKHEVPGVQVSLYSTFQTHDALSCHITPTLLPSIFPLGSSKCGSLAGDWSTGERLENSFRSSYVAPGLGRLTGHTGNIIYHSHPVNLKDSGRVPTLKLKLHQLCRSSHTESQISCK